MSSQDDLAAKMADMLRGELKMQPATSSEPMARFNKLLQAKLLEIKDAADEHGVSIVVAIGLAAPAADGDGMLARPVAMVRSREADATLQAKALTGCSIELKEAAGKVWNAVNDLLTDLAVKVEANKADACPRSPDDWRDIARGENN